MKSLGVHFLLLLLFSGRVFAAELDSDLTTARYLGEVTGSRLTTWAPTCPNGYYRLDDQCVSTLIQPAKCPSITVDGKEYGTYLLDLNFDTFHYREYNDKYPCYGMYRLYNIGDGGAMGERVLTPVKSDGSYYVINGAAQTCPHGSYRLKGNCVTYGSADATNGCESDSHMTVADQGSFMALRTELPYCRGDYREYQYTLKTDDGIYPIYNGTYSVQGAAIDVFKKMQTENRCDFRPDKYYSINLLKDSTVPSFLHPERGICQNVDGNEFKKFIVKTDCKDITTDALVAKNEICGVLCTGAGEVYTNSGRCSTEGYCTNGAKKLRLHVARPDGKKYSYPLYASKTSDPAMHFKFVNTAGAEQMCYVNLVPPEAIKHFVGTKPNPIRTMFYNPDVGKNETLITID
ncbi:MAG: hypothetical protein R8N24_00100 [Alphaproteobacteria bacterium]|nr:hypothetical protein [Alphaproteobacteria bacterium]